MMKKTPKRNSSRENHRARDVSMDPLRRGHPATLESTHPVVPVPPGRVPRVVLEPLLDRFVSYHEPKPSRCILFSCPLDIEILERHGVRHGLRSTFFDRDEVELIVDAPVVRHGVRTLNINVRIDRELTTKRWVGFIDWLDRFDITSGTPIHAASHF